MPPGCAAVCWVIGSLATDGQEEEENLNGIGTPLPGVLNPDDKQILLEQENERVQREVYLDGC